MSCPICKKETNKGCKWSPCRLLKWFKYINTNGQKPNKN